jgi:hypothetical protein
MPIPQRQTVPSRFGRGFEMLSDDDALAPSGAFCDAPMAGLGTERCRGDQGCPVPDSRVASSPSLEVNMSGETCSRCGQRVVAAARVAAARACAGCLTGEEMVEHGDALYWRLRVQFQRRSRANPTDDKLDEIFELIEKVDLALQRARLNSHLQS